MNFITLAFFPQLRSIFQCVSNRHRPERYILGHFVVTMGLLDPLSIHTKLSSSSDIMPTKLYLDTVPVSPAVEPFVRIVITHSNFQSKQEGFRNCNIILYFYSSGK